MAINKISGNILQDNLVRGANLAFQGDLLYIDIVNSRIGVNAAPTSYTLEVNGSLWANNLSTGNANVGNLNSTGAVNSVTLNASGNANVGNLGTVGQVTATGNVTGGNLITVGILSATGNVVGGNILTVGTISAAGNILTNSNVSAVGNVSGGNLLTGGILSATGNATVANINAGIGTFSNSISVTGNANVGNLGTVGLISASGNVTAGNFLTSGLISASGNVIGGNIETNGFVSALGNVVSNSNVVVGTTVLSNSSITTTSALTLLTTGNINVSNAYINNLLEPVQSTDAATKLYVDNAASNAASNLGNITFSNTTISTSVVPGNITILPTGNSTVILDTTSGAVVPVGDTAQRPSPASTGTVRFNTDTGRLEVYDGSTWVSVVSGVTNQVLQGDNSTTDFLLNRSSTTAATLVALNGVIQLPNTAYTVTGNSLSFTQAPAISDIIDVRFL